MDTLDDYQKTQMSRKVEMPRIDGSTRACDKMEMAHTHTLIQDCSALQLRECPTSEHTHPPETTIPPRNITPNFSQIQTSATQKSPPCSNSKNTPTPPTNPKGTLQRSVAKRPPVGRFLLSWIAGAENVGNGRGLSGAIGKLDSRTGRIAVGGE